MNSTRTRTLNLSQTTVSQQRAFQRFFPSTPQKGVAGSSATCVEVRVDANVQGDLTILNIPNSCYEFLRLVCSCRWFSPGPPPGENLLSTSTIQWFATEFKLGQP
eukprot:1341714-Pyramimonas_sp.AAC.1